MPQQQSNQSPYGNPYAQGGNRYIPPTFNYATNPNNNRPNYQQMDWNTMQSHYLPTNTSQGQMNNTYQQQLRGMLGQFGQQYGDPNRRPVMPNFSSYNPGFGGATSAYDQFNQYAQQLGRYSNYSNGQMPGPENFYTGFEPQGGGQMRYQDARMGSNGQWQGRNSNNEFGPEGSYEYMANQPGFDMENYGPGAPYEQYARGRMGGGQMNNSYRGRMGMMPQFNPYMMMQNSMRGMDFNQMFDPRFASLFGGDRFGSRTPNSQQRPPGVGGAGPLPDLAAGNKPLQMGGGG